MNNNKITKAMTVKIPKDVNIKLKIYAATNEIKSLQEAVILILRHSLNNNINNNNIGEDNNEKLSV